MNKYSKYIVAIVVISIIYIIYHMIKYHSLNTFELIILVLILVIGGLFPVHRSTLKKNRESRNKVIDKFSSFHRHSTFVFNNFKEMIIVVDNNGLIRKINNEVSKITGYCENDLYKTKLSDIISDHLNSDSDYPLDVNAITKDDKLFFNRKYDSPIQIIITSTVNDESENLTHIFFRDITEELRNKTENELLYNLISQIFNIIPNMIALFDIENMKILTVNEKFISIFGYDHDYFTGLKIDNFCNFDNDTLDNIKSNLTFTTTLSTPQRDDFTFEAVFRPITYNDHTYYILRECDGLDKEHINTNEIQTDQDNESSNDIENHLKNLISKTNDSVCIFEFVEGLLQTNDSSLESAKISFYNDSFIRLFGLTSNTVTGMTLKRLIGSNLLLWNDIVEDLEKYNSTELEHKIINVSGHERTVKSKIIAIRDDNNSIIGISAVTNDFTKLQSLETDLNSAIQLFVKSIDSIVDQVYVIDKNYKVKLVNKSAIQFCCGEDIEEELVGQNIFDVLDIINNDEANIEYVFESLQTLVKEDSFAYKLQKETFKKQFIPVIKNSTVSKMIIIISEISKDKIAKRALTKIKAQQKALLDNIPHIAWLKDLKGVYISVNEPFAKFHNKKISDIKGKTDFDIMPEKYALLNRESEEYVINSKQQFNVIEPFIIEGKTVWLEITRTPIFNENEKVIGTTGLALDITERKLAEEALKESEERFRQLAENLKEVFWLVDWKNNEVLYLSPSFKTVFGMNEKDVYDNFYNWFDNIHEDDKQKVYDRYVNSAHNGSFDIEYRIFKEDNETCWIRNRAFPVFDSLGNVTRIAGIADDISELKKTHTELEKLNETLELRVTERTQELELEINERIQVESALRESEGLFRGYFELGPLGMAITSPDTDWLKVNKALTDIFGYSEEELLNSKWPEITHPDDYKDEMIHFLTLLEGQITGYHLEKRFIHKDGRIIHSMLYVRGVYDDSKKIKSVLMLLQDITETKRTQEILDNQLVYEKSLAKCSQILLREDISPDQAINKTLNELFQTTKVDRICIYENYVDPGDGLCSKLIYEIASDETRKSIETSERSTIYFNKNLYRWQDLMLQKKVVTGLVTEIPEREKEFFESMNVQSFLNIPLIVDGSWEGYVGFEDIIVKRKWAKYEIDMLQTASDMIVAYIGRKKAEKALDDERASLARRVAERTKELSSANSQLAKASRLKDEFLASMSHELRTPLNAILGLSEALTEEVYGPLNEDHLSTLHTIEESGRHLLDLINDILDLSKIDAGKFNLDITNVSVATLCETSLRFVKQASIEKNIKIKTDYDKSVEILKVDQRRVKQIIVNLLSNAVKFTPENGEISLQVVGNKDKQLVKFIISDTGIGIAEEDMSKLFKPFVQLDSSLSRRHGGTGLGLSLARKLVELHGGSIQVESEVNKGSTFTVLLPWNNNYNEINQAEPDNTRGKLTDFNSILVVTANNDSLDTLMRVFSELDIEDVDYIDENTEISQVIKKSTEVLILNIDKPGEEICEIINSIDRDKVNQEIRILVISRDKTDTTNIKFGKSLNIQLPISNEHFKNTIINFCKNEEKVQTQVTISGAKQMQATQQKVILLAEDNENNINMIYDYLTAKDYIVVIARNGLEAIDLVNESIPDLILMDIQMPEMDGLKATKSIRKEEKYKNIPIIALTALAMPGDKERCLESGANDYLTKPVSLKNLVKTINSYIYQEESTHETS